MNNYDGYGGGRMNEKMQPKTKVDYRRWQHFNMGDYYYAECPKCGNTCQPDYDSYPTGKDHIRREDATCEECGCEFWYETTTVYRYGGIDK